MSRDDLAVWRTNLDNHWAVFCHTDYKLPVVAEKEATQAQKTKVKSKTPIDTPFYFNKTKQEIKGTSICTSKGYGIIQSTDNEKNIIGVKVQGVVYEFEKSEVMSDIPISVVFLKDSMRVEEKVYLAVNSTIKEFFERIEGSISSEEIWVDVKLFFQGKELERTDDTFEKLKITPQSKFLATYAPGKPMLVKRFTSSHQGWGVACSTSLDGISFQTSKNIRIIGFGMYPPTGQVDPTAAVKLIRGGNANGDVIFSQDLTLYKNNEETGDSIASRFSFDKPYLLRAGEDFSLTVSFHKSGNSHYGNGGQAKTEGEGDVTFTFRNCEGAHNGTSTASGQLPEIYYYC